MSRSFRSIGGAVALGFAALLTTVGVGQYWFLHWQLDKETKSDLWQKAESMRDQHCRYDSQERCGPFGREACHRECGGGDYQADDERADASFADPVDYLKELKNCIR